jgi:hypothetical protein
MTREEALAIVRQIEGLASQARRDDPGAQDDILYLVDQLREAPGMQDVVREKSRASRPGPTFSQRPQTRDLRR